MADSGTQQQSSQQDQQSEQRAVLDGGSQPSGQSYGESYDTPSFEQIIGSASGALSQGGLDFTQQVVASYFEMLEHHESERRTQYEATLRQTKRVTDLWAQQMILQQTTKQIAASVAPIVRQQVVAQFRQHPEWLQSSSR